MIDGRLDKFVHRLCIKNLRSQRVKCCASCPFEDQITAEYPHLAALYEAKRKRIRGDE